jgi:hypothetical protein
MCKVVCFATLVPHNAVDDRSRRDLPGCTMETTGTSPGKRRGMKILIFDLKIESFSKKKKFKN